MPLIRKPNVEPAIAADSAADSAAGVPSSAPPVATPGDAGALQAALSSDDEEIRWAAARTAAARSGSATLLAQALLHESSPRVREALFTGLSAASDAHAVVAILPFIRADDAALRTGALDALRSIGAVAGPFMPELLSDADADVRLLACELVRDVAPEQACAWLGELLDREHQPNVCAAAVEALAEAGDARVLPALQRCRERFAGHDFLAFAIDVTLRRLQSSGGATPAADDASATPRRG